MKHPPWEHVSENERPALATPDPDTTFIHVERTSLGHEALPPLPDSAYPPDAVSLPEPELSWETLLRARYHRVPKPVVVVPFSVVSSAYLLGVLHAIVVVRWVF